MVWKGQMLSKVETIFFNAVEFFIPIIAFLIVISLGILAFGFILIVALGPFALVAWAIIEAAKIVAGA